MTRFKNPALTRVLLNVLASPPITLDHPSFTTVEEDYQPSTIEEIVHAKHNAGPDAFLWIGEVIVGLWASEEQFNSDPGFDACLQIWYVPKDVCVTLSSIMAGL